ncbi:cellulose biosynthesis cyclic di-GMP-binding regulatory protein BcsB [Oscillospiraceae bacterium LTW-04]|nr:cellulose biosynthesis cyclic di-GMP-binding regulatory protein BcsB [Oscillospiraceae bacterium MB24-C1]
MKTKKRRWAAVFLFLIFWAQIGGLLPVNAAEPDAATNGPEVQSEVLSQTDLNLTGQGDAPYIHEESFGSDQSLTGLFSQTIRYFQAGEWDIRGATLTLRYDVSQLADNTVSSLTFTLNKTMFYSVRPTPGQNGKTQELLIPIPIDQIKAGQNELTIEAYIRTQDRLPCVDDVSLANWLQIFGDSTVSISYYPTMPCNTLADCYEQFTSIDALENRQSTVFVRDGGTDAELTATTLALAGLSGQAQMAYENIALQSLTDEQTLFSGKYRIFISRYDALLPSVKERLTDEQRQAAEQDAVMTLIKSNGSNVLLITGNNDAAMINAGMLLGNASYMSQARTLWRRVTADENMLMQKSEITQYRQLTEAGSYVDGLFRQSISYYMELPANRRLSTSSQVSLSMRYSENLDFNRSLVTIYVNDQPIGSKKLDKEKAQGDTIRLDIPADLMVNGNFSVRVSFDLEMQDAWCTLNQGQQPWAYVTNESMLKLMPVDFEGIIFEGYPSPFVKDGSFNNVVMVMPDSPGAADFEALRQITLTFGRFLKDNTGVLRVAHMSNTGDLKQSNVIAIGRLETNLIVQQINNMMFFQFSPQGTTIGSNEKMTIDPNYGTTLGTVQLLNSPYSEQKRALMVVTGVSDNAMLRGVEYIGLTDNLWKLYGDGYVADGVDIFPFRFKEDNAKRESLIEQLASRGDIHKLVLAVGLALMLIVVSAVMLIRKYGRQGRT